MLGDAETVEEIPCVQSKQVPARAMDINQSTVKGNADALSNLFAQGGIGDPMDTPGCRDIGDHIILVHGDLATFQSLPVRCLRHGPLPPQDGMRRRDMEDLHTAESSARRRYKPLETGQGDQNQRERQGRQ